MKIQSTFVKQCVAIGLLSSSLYANSGSAESSENAEGVTEQSVTESETTSGQITTEESSSIMGGTPVGPDSDPTIVLGYEVGSTLSNAYSSDNSYAEIDPEAYNSAYNIDASWVGMDAHGTTTPPASPTSIDISYEMDISGAPAGNNMKYRINVFNWTKGKYEMFTGSFGPFGPNDPTLAGPFGTDRLLSISITSDVSDYINSSPDPVYNGRVASRIFIYAPKTGAGAYPLYTAKFDTVTWTIND